MVSIVCKAVRRICRCNEGQSTVEYAVVLGVLLCVMIALGALMRTLDAGVFVQHALTAASHHVQASLGWAADVFGY